MFCTRTLVTHALGRFSLRKGRMENGRKMKKPIYFLSHKLSDTQGRWSTIEKEAYVIHYSLQKLDHYLHGADFIVRTDHKLLKYLLESPMQNRKVQMWALSIAGYNCDIEIYRGSRQHSSRPSVPYTSGVSQGSE